MTVICGFQGPYRFLSNFFIEPDGTHVEGEYQRAKAAIASQRGWFHVTGSELTGAFKSPAQCKAIGQKVDLRSDWDEAQLGVMEFHVRKKFQQHPGLAQLLRQTGDRRLIEWNTWGDQFWGMTGPYDKLRGLNNLGEILMTVRSEL